MMTDERAKRIGCAAIALVLVSIAIAANPLNLPVFILDQWMDRKLPPPSSIVVVRNTIEQERWQTAGEWDLGDNSGVQVLLGREWYPRRRYVYAFFIFDPFGRLLSTTIRKSVTPLSASESPID